MILQVHRDPDRYPQAKMEAKSTQLRRSRRISHNVNYAECSERDDDLTTTLKRDELTGRGFVSNIEGIAAIEFSTLEDMKLYDSVAERVGIESCASFNEFSCPFRGFTNDECSSWENYLIRFKDSTNMKSSGKSKQFGVIVNDILKVEVPKPIKSSKSKREERLCNDQFVESATCGPHRKKSCARCIAMAKPPIVEQNEVITLLTPTASPNSSFHSVMVPSADSQFDMKFEDDLLLTPVGCMPSSLEAVDHYSNNLSSNDQLDMASIPYMFKCCALDECLSPKTCANSSSNFTLCLKLTIGRGRPVSKFAIKYLDENKKSNIVDSISASIAATAVYSSARTIFLPIKKELFKSLFPQSQSLLHDADLQSRMKLQPNSTLNSSINMGSLPQCSDRDESPSSCNATLRSPRDIFYPDTLELDNVQKESVNDELSPDSSSINDQTHVPSKRRSVSNVSQDTLTKRPLESSSHLDYERSPKISKGCSKLKEQNGKPMDGCCVVSSSTCDNNVTLIPELDPLSFGPEECHIKSQLYNASPKTKRVVQTDRFTEPSSSDIFPVVTASLNYTSPVRFASSTLNVDQRESSSISLCHLPQCIPITSEEDTCGVEAIIDLTTTENDTTTIVHQQARPKKRKAVYPCSSRLPAKVTCINGNQYEENDTLVTNRKSREMRRLLSNSSVSPVTIPAMDAQKANSIPNSLIIDLTDSNQIDETAANSNNIFVDLTLEDDAQATIEVIPETRLGSVFSKDELFSERLISTKSSAVPCNERFAKNDSATGSPVFLQELALMCKTVPSFGYIKVIRYPNGELFINETFTAYKNFEDLKALITYLNQRFDKMSGVQARGPLVWILATPGVIKLKKVLPINPKVWFHPNDYVLLEHGSEKELMVLLKPKPKSSSNVTSCSSTPLILNEVESLLSIPVAKANSATPIKLGVNSFKPTTAHHMPVSIIKNHPQTVVEGASQPLINKMAINTGSFQPEVDDESANCPKIIQTVSLSGVSPMSQRQLKGPVYWTPKTGSIVNNQFEHGVIDQANVGMSQNMTLKPNFGTSRTSIVQQNNESFGDILGSSCSAPSAALLPSKECGQPTAKDTSTNIRSIPLTKPNSGNSVAVLANKQTYQSIVNHRSKAFSRSTRSLKTGQTVKLVLTHQPKTNDYTAQTVTKSKGPSVLLTQSKHSTTKSSLNTQAVQPSKPHILITPDNSVVDNPIIQNTDPDKSTTSRPVLMLCSPSNQKFSTNMQKITLDKPIASQKVATRQPIKLIPLIRTAKSTTITGNPINNQPPNLSKKTTEYSDAMIYFPPEGNTTKGIPVQNFSPVSETQEPQNNIQRHPVKLHSGTLNTWG